MFTSDWDLRWRQIQPWHMQHATPTRHTIDIIFSPPAYILINKYHRKRWAPPPCPIPLFSYWMNILLNWIQPISKFWINCWIEFCWETENLINFELNFLEKWKLNICLNWSRWKREINKYLNWISLKTGQMNWIEFCKKSRIWPQFRQKYFENG